MTEQTLLSLKKGETGTVCGLSADAKMLRRFLDMGCTVGADISLLGEAPLGGIRAYWICGSIIAIRGNDAANIRIRKASGTDTKGFIL